MFRRLAGSRPGVPIDLSSDAEEENANINGNTTIEIDDDDDDVTAPQEILIRDDTSEVDYVREEPAHTNNEEEVQYLPHGPTIDRAVAPLGATIRPGVCAELPDGDFLFVKYLTQVHSPLMSGYLLRRLGRCNALMPRRINELAMVLNAEFGSGTEPPADSCLVTMPVARAMCVRQLTVTNLPYPQGNYYFEKPKAMQEYFDENLKFIASKTEKIKETEPLVCRWKWVTFQDQVDRKIKEEAFFKLRQPECSQAVSMRDVRIAEQWRGLEVESTTSETRSLVPRSFDKGKKRACIDNTRDDNDAMEGIEGVETTFTHKRRRIDGTGSEPTSSSRATTSMKSFFPLGKKKASNDDRSQPAKGQAPTKAYTYGDICAGAGGMTSGAQQAGLHMKFLLDCDKDACATCRLNFPNAEVMHMKLQDFCKPPYRIGYKVDVLHISYPCKSHSLLNTRGESSKHYWDNIDVGYTVEQLLQTCKPRIVTFEQTTGILKRGGHHFRSLIRQITAMDYSVRWKSINLAEHGNPQARPRLGIIAAAPGEKLPEFPKPTHGAGRGLKPLTTIHDSLLRVPRVDDVDMMQFTKKSGRPYDPRQPLKACITCSGGDSDLHPDGKRSFTMRELALLQSFPPTHNFSGTKTSIREQIGNAVPSCFGKAMFESIVQSLKETDREHAAYKPETIELD